MGSRFEMGFGGALAAREENGAPWVPPWWQRFVIVPLAVPAMYIVFPVDRDNFNLSNLLKPAAWTLGDYYIVILPIFDLRRYRWDKKHDE